MSRRCYARVEDINVYIARGQITAGEIAHGNVNAAGGVVKERASTDGRVVVAGGVLTERLKTGRQPVLSRKRLSSARLRRCASERRFGRGRFLA